MRWTTLLYFLLVPATIGQSLTRFELFLSTDRRLSKHPVTHGVTLEDGAFDGNGHLVIKGRGNPKTAAQGLAGLGVRLPIYLGSLHG